MIKLFNSFTQIHSFNRSNLNLKSQNYTKLLIQIRTQNIELVVYRLVASKPPRFSHEIHQTFKKYKLKNYKQNYKIFTDPLMHQKGARQYIKLESNFSSKITSFQSLS